MTKRNFREICEDYNIAPGIALENSNVYNLLKADKGINLSSAKLKLRKLLRDEF